MQIRHGTVDFSIKHLWFEHDDGPAGTNATVIYTSIFLAEMDPAKW